ncbi:GntR family transcriptional regulator [Oceanidesulfovibrio marinus]|nr:GntR family transcriptional regulator [Oceanidesulfovibrio marinus]
MKILGVADSTACFLRHEIITGKIPPGSKLNEVELANRYGVSRPPLREAFRKLEYEKLVNNIPRRGTFVTELSFDDCREVYFTRRTLECAAVDLLAKSGNRDFTKLSESVENLEHFAMPRNSDTTDLADYYGEIAGFHWDLVKDAGNRWLTHCYQSIASTLSRYQLIYLSILSKRSIEDHKIVVECMQEGRFEEAKKQLAEHISRVLNEMLDNI